MINSQLLQPNLVLGGSILDLSLEIIQQHHLKGLILDVDETIVPIRTRDTTPELEAWLQGIRDHVKIWLVSNNLSENRIQTIANRLDLPYIVGAKKPSRKKLRQAAEDMGLGYGEIAMVGDRLFTDVLAGNRLGVFTILVNPMVDPRLAPRTYPLRDVEVWISQKLGVTL